MTRPGRGHRARGRAGLTRVCAALLALPAASGDCDGSAACPEALGGELLLLQTGRSVEPNPSLRAAAGAEPSPALAQRSGGLRASALPPPWRREGDRLPRWRWAWADAWEVPGVWETVSKALSILWNWSALLVYGLVMAYYQVIEAEEKKKRGQLPPPERPREEEDPKQEERGQERLAALSGIRSPLIFLIYLHHMGIYMFPEAGCFFVLSGFVLSWSRRGEAPGTAKRPFGSVLDVLVFYSCRLVRVLPLYWVCYAASTVKLSSSIIVPLRPLRFAGWLIWRMAGLPFTHTRQWLVTGTRDAGWWFVTCIVVHYAMYPLAEMAITSRTSPGQRWRAMVLLVAAAGAKIIDLVWLSNHINMDSLTVFGVAMETYKASVPFLDGWTVDHYFTPLCRLPEFLLGVALPHLPPPDFAELREQLKGSAAWRWCPGCADVVGLTMAAIILFAPCKALFLLLMDNNVMCFGQALLFYCLAFGSSYVGSFLSWKPLVWHGNLVYALYLIQYSALSQLDDVHPGTRMPTWPPDAAQVSGFQYCPFNVFVETLVGLVLGTVIAWALYHLVERPCIELWGDALSFCKLK